MARIGISDVAAHAGVSEATVSRVVNRRGVVASGTRKLVEDAIRELGYDRGVTSQLVIVLTPGLAQPFFGRLCELIEAALAQQGLKAVVCSTTVGGLQEVDFVRSMMDLGIAGAVFASASNTLVGADPAVYRLLRERNIPIVTMNGNVAGIPAPDFATDDRLAARLAVEHLASLGHRAIGMLAGPVGNKPSDRRVDGYLDAMSGLGEPDPIRLLARQAYTVEGGQAAAESLVSAGATGLIAASDYMALGAVRAVRRAGLAVPRDVSVVGYDDSQIMEFVDPPMTTVRQPVDRIAQAIATAMIHLVNGRDVPAGELLFDPELVVRGTTASAGS
jgi:DNA-binding LacI/PurR family transcriptional regulator